MDTLKELRKRTKLGQERKVSDHRTKLLLTRRYVWKEADLRFKALLSTLPETITMEADKGNSYYDYPILSDGWRKKAWHDKVKTESHSYHFTRVTKSNIQRVLSFGVLNDHNHMHNDTEFLIAWVVAKKITQHFLNQGLTVYHMEKYVELPEQYRLKGNKFLFSFVQISWN